MVLTGGTDFACPARRAELVEEFRVISLESLPLSGDVILVIDRLHWAYGLASAAIDTLIWLDVEHPVALIDAIDRTFLDTGLVLDIDTRFSDDVCHEVAIPSL